MVQRVKDLAFSLLWLRLSPWPRNFYMLQMWPKKKKIRLWVRQEKVSMLCSWVKTQVIKKEKLNTHIPIPSHTMYI